MSLYLRKMRHLWRLRRMWHIWLCHHLHGILECFLDILKNRLIVNIFGPSNRSSRSLCRVAWSAWNWYVVNRFLWESIRYTLLAQRCEPTTSARLTRVVPTATSTISLWREAIVTSLYLLLTVKKIQKKLTYKRFQKIREKKSSILSKFSKYPIKIHTYF